MNILQFPTPPLTDDRPGQLCSFCWPTLKVADLWDEGGFACCHACSTKPQRKCRLPAWSMRDVS